MVLTMTGCALFGSGDTEPPTAKGYTIRTPQHWIPQPKNQSDYAFKLPTGPVLTVTSTCAQNADAPLEVLTRHLLIGSRNITILRRAPKTIDGVGGLFSEVRATYDKEPFFLNVFVLPKLGCVFDFTLISPKPIPVEETQEFLNFLESFHYGEN